MVLLPWSVLRYHEVADNIYFMSWPTQGEGGDNVVVNFDAMTVNAHLGGGDRFRLIHGIVHCRNSSDCVAPEGDVMSPDEVMQTLMANAQRTGLAGPSFRRPSWRPAGSGSVVTCGPGRQGSAARQSAPV